MRSVSAWKRRALAAAALVGVVSACRAWQGPVVPVLPVIADATPVGAERCIGCHVHEAEVYRPTPHAALLTTRPDGCEHCHGAGSKHVESVAATDIVGPEALRALAPAERSALCLGCHGARMPRFADSEHAGTEVSCWDCHAEALHQAPPALAQARFAMKSDPPPAGPRPVPLIPTRDGGREVQLCLSCHEAVAADFLLQFHHPVPEAAMRCSDCHAVHGEDRQAITEHANERCLSCHEEIRGPFVFDHLAIDDGCTVCHTPHGSTVEKLLIQDNNGICEQCHFDANYPLIGAVDHTPFLSGGARCYDCHFQIHGSNTDENFIPLRIEELRRRGGLR